jgi:multicomponent Na+:H+ antiporter subunit B
VSSLILRTATRFLVSLMLVFSVFLLVRGHDAPGGGFLGAMIASIAFVLYTLADGPAAVLRTLRVAPRTIAIVGLGLALLAGLVAALAGAPVFTGLWMPVDEELGLGTPLLFDLGVYIAVVGAVLTIVLALDEEA